mgnify:CR=1 FL=1
MVVFIPIIVTIYGIKVTIYAPIGMTLAKVLSYITIGVTSAIIVGFIGFGLYHLFKKWF